jgi:hypothetical protein
MNYCENGTGSALPDISLHVGQPIEEGNFRVKCLDPEVRY